MGPRPGLGHHVALVGDTELDEGNVYEALQEGWKNDLCNRWWFIDYNRQPLDGAVREALFGWAVIRVKYGAFQRAAFEEAGGSALCDWIDACPNQLNSALAFQGGAACRKWLVDDLDDQGPVEALIRRRSAAELTALTENLGGDCVTTMADILQTH